MVSTWSLDLFKDPFFIGFNRELDRLNNAYKTNSQSYPPYDLIKLDEDTYRISLAVAGFSKGDIDVSVDNGTLIIKGEIVDESVESGCGCTVASNCGCGQVLHKGIAGRKFVRSFALGEYMEVNRAEMADGILSVFVERNVPEEKKPKTIKIK